MSEALKTVVARSFGRALDKVLPSVVEREFTRIFKDKPDKQLNEVGFNWALALALRERWPDVTNAEAVRWLREYIDAPHGHPDYDWSASAAQVVVAEYINEVGEVA